MGPNTQLHIQVSVSLVPYELKVSYYYDCICTVHVVRSLVLASAVDDVHSTSKNTHTRDAPQAQTDPNNMICCHTTTLSIQTTVFK